MYTQGGTCSTNCSTNCDFNGASAGFGRLASEEGRILMEKDAIAISRYQWERNIDDFCKTERLTNFPYAPLANSLLVVQEHSSVYNIHETEWSVSRAKRVIRERP